MRSKARRSSKIEFIITFILEISKTNENSEKLLKNLQNSYVDNVWILQIQFEINF